MDFVGGSVEDEKQRIILLRYHSFQVLCLHFFFFSINIHLSHLPQTAALHFIVLPWPHLVISAVEEGILSP